MKTSNAVSSLMPALLDARHNMVPPTKDADNPFFKSKYADYPAIIDAVMGCLYGHDLVLTIAPGLLADGVLDVHARITHATTGQYIATTMGMPLGKEATPQSTGSAITYASRYLVQALLCLPSHDDDGQLATKEAKKVKAHPDYAEWKRTLEKCKDEAELEVWIERRYSTISASVHKEELNGIYQAMLDKFRNA